MAQNVTRSLKEQLEFSRLFVRSLEITISSAPARVIEIDTEISRLKERKDKLELDVMTAEDQLPAAKRKLEQAQRCYDESEFERRDAGASAQRRREDRQESRQAQTNETRIERATRMMAELKRLREELAADGVVLEEQS